MKSRKGYHTRMSLLSAAFELIAEHGLQTLTVASICERVGLQRSSFYNHFEHLQALLDTLVLQVLDDIGRRSVEASQKQAVTTSMLEFRVRFLFELSLEEPSFGKVLYELYTFHPPAVAHVKSRIVLDIGMAQQRDHLVLSDREADALAHIFVASIIDGLDRLTDPSLPDPDIESMLTLLFKAAGYDLK